MQHFSCVINAYRASCISGANILWQTISSIDISYKCFLIEWMPKAVKFEKWRRRIWEDFLPTEMYTFHVPTYIFKAQNSKTLHICKISKIFQNANDNLIAQIEIKNLKYYIVIFCCTFLHEKGTSCAWSKFFWNIAYIMK